MVSKNSWRCVRPCDGSTGIQYVRSFLQKRLPQIRMTQLEGTYLAWLDCRGLGLSPKQLEHLILEEAGLWVDSGAMFGVSGEGFERFNIACPRKTLEQALERMEAAIKLLTTERKSV